MGIAGALAALIVAGPVNVMDAWGNALTLPSARHLVRLDPQNGKPAAWLLAVQQDGSGGHWLGFWRSDEPQPAVDLIIYTAPLPEYHQPIRLAIREHGRHAASPLTGVKTISWLNNVWSVAEAQKDGFDEVIMLNERGEVAECTAANLYIVKGDTVFTPPLSSGCLEGVTRSILFEIVGEAGAIVKEHTLRVEDLYSADEIFISSTNRNVIAVGEVCGHKFGNAAGPVTLRMNEAFTTYLNDYVTRRLAAASR